MDEVKRGRLAKYAPRERVITIAFHEDTTAERLDLECVSIPMFDIQGETREEFLVRLAEQLLQFAEGRIPTPEERDARQVERALAREAEIPPGMDRWMVDMCRKYGIKVEGRTVQECFSQLRARVAKNA